MKKEEQLLHEITELVKETKNGKIKWEIKYQTTEYNDPVSKPVEEEEGEKWVVDECFVEYHCTCKEKEFLLTSYEQMFTCGDKVKSCNLLFIPPEGMRFFDVDILAPYAISADHMLTYQVHTLWLTILEQYKKKPELVKLDVTPRDLVL